MEGTGGGFGKVLVWSGHVEAAQLFGCVDYITRGFFLGSPDGYLLATMAIGLGASQTGPYLGLGEGCVWAEGEVL